MKGYIINNKCYVFPQEVGQLPSIDAEVIYVQEEDIKAWKEANVELGDKIKKYNYNVMTVNPKEWSGHKDDELTPPQTYNINYDVQYNGSGGFFEPHECIDHDMITSASEGDIVTLYLKDTTLLKYEGCSYSAIDVSIDPYVDGSSTLEVTQIDTFTYQFTMPANNVNCLIFLDSPVYGLTVSGDKSQYVDYMGITEAHQGESVDLGIIDGGNNLQTYTFNTSVAGKTILAVNWTGIEASNVTYDSEYDRWNFTMPANAVNAEVNVYNQA